MMVEVVWRVGICDDRLMCLLEDMILSFILEFEVVVLIVLKEKFDDKIIVDGEVIV